jgi:gas vesicle protein
MGEDYGNMLGLDLNLVFKSAIMERGKIILGVLAGVTAGALIGVLFAPDKGTETRKKIVHKGEEYVDNLKEKVNGILRNGKKRHETVTETAA